MPPFFYYCLMGIIISVQQIQTVTVTYEDDININGFYPVAFVKGFGYPMEVHKNIETEDGYLLDMHRIPHGRNGKGIGTKGPVLFNHGLAGNGENFIVMGPNVSIAFYLADKGYDVWMMHSRGTSHSKKHKKLLIDDPAFWDFSWHEIGYYDIPANMEYILKTTGKKKLFYCGHSQGTTTFFVMTSTRPEMNKKVRLMLAMAPSAYVGLEHVALPETERSVLFKNIDLLRETLGVTEVGSQIRTVFCNPAFASKEFCEAVMLVPAIGSGGDLLQLDWEKVPEMLKTFPDSSAAKQFLHYMQSILSGNFSYYDKGPVTNLRVYKSLVPPAYPLEKITAPVGLFVGLLDSLATPPNVARLAKKLPNVVLNYLVPYPFFTHLDFVVAKDARKLLYHRMYSLMSEY